MSKIEDLIDIALEPKPRERSGKWNPSSFGNCYRAQYWNRKNEEKSNPPDKRAMRVFKAGQLFHDFIQGLLPDAEIEVEVECEDVKGFADIVLKDEVADIKSQHSRSFWWMVKKDFDVKKEKYGNWLQVMYYARELGKNFGRLIFVSKDDLCIQEYVQPLDEYWFGEVELELANLRDIWTKNELPPAKPRCKFSYSKKTGECKYWHCTYCNWKDKCKELEGENWPATVMSK